MKTAIALIGRTEKFVKIYIPWRNLRGLSPLKYRNPCRRSFSRRKWRCWRSNFCRWRFKTGGNAGISNWTYCHCSTTSTTIATSTTANTTRIWTVFIRGRNTNVGNQRWWQGWRLLSSFDAKCQVQLGVISPVRPGWITWRCPRTPTWTLLNVETKKF